MNNIVLLPSTEVSDSMRVVPLSGQRIDFLKNSLPAGTSGLRVKSWGAE